VIHIIYSIREKERERGGEREGEKERN